MEFALLILRLIAGTGGAILMYGGAFLYETEERSIQNILDNWWIRVDDLKQSAVSRHAAFVRATAQLTSTALDRIFGRQILSLRAIATSGCLSLASFHALSALLFDWLKRFEPFTWDHIKTSQTQFELIWRTAVTILGMLLQVTIPADRLLTHSLTALSIIAVFLASLSARFARLPALVFGTYCITFGTIGIAFLRPLRGLLGTPRTILIALAVGILCDILAISCIRLLLRWQAWQLFARSVAAASLQLALALSLLVGPGYAGWLIFSVGHGQSRHVQLFGVAVVFSTLTNAASVFVALAFWLVLVTLILHALVWPMISRPLYALARAGVFRNKFGRSTVFALGSALVAVALGYRGDVVSNLERIWGAG